MMAIGICLAVKVRLKMRKASYLIFILILSVGTIAIAQEVSQKPVAKACSWKEPEWPRDALFNPIFRNLKGVLISISFEGSIAQYPVGLSPDIVATVLKQQVEKEIQPFVMPDDNCKVSEIIFFSHQLSNKFVMGEDLKKEAAKDGNLTIGVRVSKFDKIHPPVAILRTYFYRHGASLQSQISPSSIVVIPYNLTEEEVGERIEAFIHGIKVLTADILIP